MSGVSRRVFPETIPVLDFRLQWIRYHWILLDSIGAKDSLGVRGVKESVSGDYSSIVHKDCDRTNLKSPQEFILKRTVPRFALLVLLICMKQF